ncbi:MAG: hypothetical protein QM808_03140 [Steroidobacteraceae bacterium]
MRTKTFHITAAIFTASVTLTAYAQGMGGSMTKDTPADAVPNPDPHMISGMWSMRGQTETVVPTLKPEYADKVDTRNLSPSAARQGGTKADELCLPHGFFGGLGTYPTLIMQTGKQITLVNEENHRFRRIYLDGVHPKQLQPSFAGHSIGRWQGDVLVVDTVGLRSRDGGTNLPGYHIIERIKKVANGKQLEIQVIYDSAAHAAPGRQTTLLNWRPDLHIQEQVCEEFSDNFNESYKFK